LDTEHFGNGLGGVCFLTCQGTLQLAHWHSLWKGNSTSDFPIINPSGPACQCTDQLGVDFALIWGQQLQHVIVRDRKGKKKCPKSIYSFLVFMFAHNRLTYKKKKCIFI